MTVMHALLSELNIRKCSCYGPVKMYRQVT